MSAGNKAYLAAVQLLNTVAVNVGQGIGCCEMRRYCRLAGSQGENTRRLREALANIEAATTRLEGLTGEPAHLMRYRLDEARLGVTKRKPELTMAALEKLVKHAQVLPDLAYRAAYREARLTQIRDVQQEFADLTTTTGDLMRAKREDAALEDRT